MADLPSMLFIKANMELTIFFVSIIVGFFILKLIYLKSGIIKNKSAKSVKKELFIIESIFVILIIIFIILFLWKLDVSAINIPLNETIV